MKATALLFTITLLAASSWSCSRAEGPPVTAAAPAPYASITGPRKPCVNLNTATVEELTRLPGIGEVTAGKIAQHRADHGPFRRPEEVIIVDGFSERKYRALAGLVCVE
jgi:competence protein ComEA